MASLLEELHKQIETTYAMDTGIDDVAKYVIGDKTYRHLYGRENTATSVNSSVSRARVLIRQNTEPLRVSLYYPDQLIEKLERYDPRWGVYDINIDEVAIFTEELDHLLLIAQNYKYGKPFSLLGLELHANITKYLILSYFIAQQMALPQLNPVFRNLLKHHLFERNQYISTSTQIHKAISKGIPVESTVTQNPASLNFKDQQSGENWRYIKANRLAQKYISFLETLDIDTYRQEIRRFNKLTSAEMVKYVEKIA